MSLLVVRRCLAKQVRSFHTFSTFSAQSNSNPNSNSYEPSPSPPRLPPDEQAEFERLQRSSTGAFSRTSPSSSLPSSSDTPTRPTTSQQASISSTTLLPPTQSQTAPSSPESCSQPARPSSADSHPDARVRPPPEFEGERNPLTGEVGGPKWEPVRWGSDGVRGDWSFGGRVSDF